MGDRESKETLGARVKALREKNHMTQAELAKVARLSPGAIGDIEANRQRSTTKIDLLAAALKTTVAYLRDGKESSVVHEATLSDREVKLIEAYRQLTESSRLNLDGFILGLPKKRSGKIDAPVERLLQSPGMARNRRSG